MTNPDVLIRLELEDATPAQYASISKQLEILLITDDWVDVSASPPHMRMPTGLYGTSHYASAQAAAEMVIHVVRHHGLRCRVFAVVRTSDVFHHRLEKKS